MLRITLINEGIMKCRFQSLHAKMVRGDMDSAMKFTKETLDILQNAVENEMSEALTDYYMEVLERTKMEIRHQMYGCTLERVWTLAFTNNLYL